jgi:hypothetical protein
MQIIEINFCDSSTWKHVRAINIAINMNKNILNSRHYLYDYKHQEKQILF